MRRFLSSFLIVLTLGTFLANVPPAHGSVRLLVTRDGNSPVSSFVSACQLEVPILKLKFAADVNAVQVTDFYLANVDPVSKQVTAAADSLIESYVFDYGTGKVSATPVNGLVHFPLGDSSSFVIPESSSTTVTISAKFHPSADWDSANRRIHLATVAIAQPGGSIDPTSSSNYVSGTVDGVRARFYGIGTLLTPDGVTGESYDFIAVKSRPHFIPLASSSEVLVPGGQQELLRFAVTTDACGEVDLGKLSFNLTVNSVDLQGITLYDYTSGNIPLNSVQPDLLSGGGGNSATIALELDRNLPSNGETISAGSSKIYVLKADVSALGSGLQTISANLAGETGAFASGQYDSIKAASKLVWSDVSSLPHSVTGPGSSDWFNGAYLQELPLANTVLSSRASFFTTTLQVALSSYNHLPRTVSTNLDKVPFTIYTFTAPPSQELVLYQITLHRGGSGNPGHFQAVWLEQNGQQIAAKQVIGSDNRAVFILDTPVTVPRGTSTDIAIMAAMDPTVSSENSLSIMESNDVLSSANFIALGAPISGSLIRTTPFVPNNNANLNNNASTNQGDLIQRIDGPQAMPVEQTENWQVITDPELGLLHYNVNWGDMNNANQNNNGNEQTEARFNHMYRDPGVYRLTFTVRTGWGQTEQRTLLVRVGNLTSDIPPALFPDPVFSDFNLYVSPLLDIAQETLPGKSVLELFRRGVVNGYADKTFRGDLAVNRAEIAKMILLARYGFIVKNTGVTTFPDVATAAWYSRYISLAFSQGILGGYPDGWFRPEREVNTAEFLKMVTRTFVLTENLPYAYADVTPSDWFARYAGVAQKYDLFPGRTGGMLLPAKNMTRTEVAVALYQLLRNY